jgi:Secretory lipase
MRRLFAIGICPALAAAGLAIPTAHAADDFYSTPGSLPPHNGDIVRSEPASFYLDPLKAIPAPAKVNRIMYRSTDADGEPIAVTGTVLTPTKAWSGRGERPIVGYAVGTQGLGDQCAPSRQLAAGTEYEGAFLSGLLARGYGVVVTDYQGLGTAGVHTYVVRRAQAAAVLDSIRAAQRLPAAGLPDDGPVGTSGFSQGGGASAAAVELHPSYAPELDLKGSYAGAVPADLLAIATYIDGGLYSGFLYYALNGLTSAYGLEADAMARLNARGREAFVASRNQCVVETVARYPLTRSSDVTADGRSVEQLMQAEPYKSVVAAQRIGTLKPTAPALVIGSLGDDIIPYPQGRAMARSWCAKGAYVRFSTYLSPTHIGTAVAAFPEAFAFLEARFADVPFVSTCGRF